MRKCLHKMGLAIAITLPLFTYGASWAQTGSFGIAPAFPKEGNMRSKSIFIHTLKSGGVAEDGVRIYNYTKEPRTIQLDAVDSLAAADGSFSCKQNSEKKTDVGAWVELSQRKVSIAPGTNEMVKFTIKVPQQAAPGEHGACITAQDTKDTGDSKDARGVVLSFRNAIRLAVTVPGDIVKKLSIVEVDIRRNDAGNYLVSPVAKNDGNVSLDVTARVQLKSIFGQTSEIKSADYPIIAGAKTGWGFEFKQPFWGGFYRAYTSLAYDADPGSGIGDKTSDQRKARRDTGYFFMMPTPRALAAEVAVPAVLVLWLAIKMRRRHHKRTAHKRLHQYRVKSGDTVMSIATAHGMKWKKLAKLNGLKAPYLLEAGQALAVAKPRLAGRRLVKKTMAPSREGWLIDETTSKTAHIDGDMLEQPTARVPQPQDAHSFEQPTRAHAGWVAPREALPAATPRPSAPRVPNAAFPEPMGVDIPDWREGATEDELRQLGVLQDSTHVPQLNRSWDMDATDEISEGDSDFEAETAPKKAKRKGRAPAKHGTRKKPRSPK